MTPDRDYQQFYSDEAPRYDEHRYKGRYGRVFRELHHEAIQSLLPSAQPGARLLEIACGTGHATEVLARGGFNVVATDLTNSMLEHARERLRALPVEFMEADARDLPFAASEFDVVVATRFMHLFAYEGQLAILEEMGRVVRPGGRIVVDFDNRTSHRILAPPLFLYNISRYRRLRPDTHYNDPADIRRLFDEAGLELDSLVGVGGYHLLLPAVFSHGAAVAAGRSHRRPPLRFLAEQLAAVGTRR